MVTWCIILLFVSECNKIDLNTNKANPNAKSNFNHNNELKQSKLSTHALISKELKRKSEGREKGNGEGFSMKVRVEKNNYKQKNKGKKQRERQFEEVFHMQEGEPFQGLSW